MSRAILTAWIFFLDIYWSMLIVCIEILMRWIFKKKTGKRIKRINKETQTNVKVHLRYLIWIHPIHSIDIR